MICFAQIAADEVAKLSELHTTNGAHLFVDTSCRPLWVHDTKVRLAINPHLHERHRIAAVGLQVGQELWDFDSCCALHYPCLLNRLLFAGVPTRGTHNLLLVQNKLLRLFLKTLSAVTTSLRFNRDDFCGHPRTFRIAAIKSSIWSGGMFSSSILKLVWLLQELSTDPLTLWSSSAYRFKSAWRFWYTGSDSLQACSAWRSPLSSADFFRFSTRVCLEDSVGIVRCESSSVPHICRSSRRGLIASPDASTLP